MRTYRCTQCSRVGYAFAFWWLAPESEQQRAAAQTRGATVPTLPLVAEPSVWCPACKTPGTVVDQDGKAVDPLSPPAEAHMRPDPVAGDYYRSVNRVLRARVAGVGR
jgi:hypothetical protein